MEVSANVRRTEPTPRREQDGETYSAATRSRSTSTQPIATTRPHARAQGRATASAAPLVASPAAPCWATAAKDDIPVADRPPLIVGVCEHASSPRGENNAFESDPFRP